MDIDSHLRQLSLSDLIHTDNGMDNEIDNEMDNDMDIDDMDIDEEQKEQEHQQEDHQEEDHQEEEQKHSDHEENPQLLVVSLLSPTSMGAQYALKSEHDADYEYDLDRYPQVQKDTTSFSSGVDRSVFNAPANTWNYPTWHRPVHIHHFHHVVQNQPQSGYMQDQPKEQVKHNEISQPLRLPLPWENGSVPAERSAYVLSSYLQLLVNGAISVYGFHILWVVVRAIRQDVAHKLRVHATNRLVEIASCERSYRENNCSPEQMVPALEKMCAYWEKCKNQDPHSPGNASSVGAYTLGLIVTSLVEPLSLKVLLVLSGAFVLVYLCNFAFGYVRARTYYGGGR